MKEIIAKIISALEEMSIKVTVGASLLTGKSDVGLFAIFWSDLAGGTIAFKNIGGVDIDVVNIIASAFQSKPYSSHQYINLNTVVCEWYMNPEEADTVHHGHFIEQNRIRLDVLS